MKTVEDLNRLIRDEITAIEALRSEDEKIWSVRGGVTEANAKRSKKIRRMKRPRLAPNVGKKLCSAKTARIWAAPIATGL